MVDIIKLPLHEPTYFSSNIHNSRSKQFSQQITLPIYLSTTNHISSNDRLNNNIPTKRWVGNCPTNPSRLLDVSNSPYSIHRKIMYQELSRHYPTTSDLSKPGKNKPPPQQPRNATKDSATTATGSGTTNITSQASFNNGDMQNSRLFDTLSKHVTIKAEPLRPSNNFTTSTNNTTTTWQKYWTSALAQRRRKEANDPEPVLYRPKREKSVLGQTHFVVLRDSPYLNSEIYEGDNPMPSTPPNGNSPTKVFLTAPTSDKQISSTKENDINKTPHQLSTIEFVASSLIPSSIEIKSSRHTSKTSMHIPRRSTAKDEEKYLTEKSLLISSSTQIKNDCQIIENVPQGQIQSRPITTKVYRLSLPSAKPKSRKNSPVRRRTRSKSIEKKQSREPSASKRQRQPSANKKSANKAQLPRIMTRIPRSKYSQAEWAEPYIGLRFDPPTPPCSPSAFVWFQDSDQEDHDTPFEKSEFFQHDVTVNVLEN